MSKSDEKLAERLLSLRKHVSPDDICEFYAAAGAILKIRQLDNPAEGEGVPSMLIEGDKLSFLFLADLLLAQADALDCGSEISPTGPGNLLFNSESTFGLYLHSLPCSNKPAPSQKPQTT